MPALSLVALVLAMYRPLRQIHTGQLDGLAQKGRIARGAGVRLVRESTPGYEAFRARRTCAFVSGVWG